MSSSNRFHLEIEVDNIDSQERMDALVEAFQIIAGQCFMQFMLIAGENPKPVITLWAENYEDGKTDVPLARPEGE